MSRIARWSLLFAVLLVPSLAEAQPIRKRPRLGNPDQRAQQVLDVLGPEHIVREAWRVTRRYFYDRSVLTRKDWNASLKRALKRVHGVRSPRVLYREINRMLAELETSHLALVESRVWERELALEFLNRPSLRAGCELVELDGHYYVAGIARGGPADTAGLLNGDEVLTLAGKPPAESPLLQEAGHDPGLPGPPGYCLDVRSKKPIPLRIRREKDGPIQDVSLVPGLYSWVKAAQASVRVETIDGVKVGVVHTPHFMTSAMYQVVRKAIQGDLAKTQALVLDIRGRGGSTRVVYAIFNLFAGYRAQWTKPVVILTDRGTRSAKEIFAWRWKRDGVGPIVGERTQGACIGCGFHELSDGSVLMVPRVDVRRLTRGVNLEGQGVKPTIPVEDAPLPYKAGKDPILQAGLQKAAALTRKKKRSEAY